MLTDADILTLLEEALKLTQQGSVIHHDFRPDLALLGADGALDSLDTMIFLNHLDVLLSKRLDRTLTLVNDELLSREPNPLRSMRTLADYIGDFLRAEEEFL